MTTYVLIHGGWHGAWCWRKVVDPLRAAGHRVFTPTLTGLGERAHLARPSVDLGTHVDDVLAHLHHEDVHDAVLVGHSYSGMVVTAVAERAGPAVRSLVYLDAFLPEPGQSVFDTLPEARRAVFLEAARCLGDGWLVPLDWDTALASWGVTDPDDLRWMRPRLTPQPLATLRQPLPPLGGQRPPGGPRPERPRLFVACTRGPMAGTFAQFAEKVRDQDGWTVGSIDAGHDAMITAPKDVVGLLLERAI